MKTARFLSNLGTIIMFVILIYGFAKGDFFKEGSILVNMPWGHVSLVDVYIGFFLFSGWVFYRENSIFVALIWFLLILVLGNFITCLYTSLALYKAVNFNQFWLGKHAQNV